MACLRVLGAQTSGTGQGMRGGILFVLALCLHFATSEVCEKDGTCGAEGGVYVSFVMVGRVDGLRGDYVGRLRNSMQFIQELSVIHKLSSEVVIVEWNPLPGYDSLANVLKPYKSSDPSAPPVRIITVPPEFHTSVAGDTGQSFFEFLGKNVGSRRARGEFILITNGDIVFNDEVFAFLAKRRIDADSYFRIPRVETSAAFDPEEPLERRLATMRSMSSSLSSEPLCDEGTTFCPGRHNQGVCERGFLGHERHESHFGLADALFLPAAGDFFLLHTRLMHLLGGYHSIPSTTHLDSLLLCKASGAGFRQIVLTRPCLMYHQKHPAKDMQGFEVSDACIDQQMGGVECRRRFLLEGWELTDDRCQEIELDTREALGKAEQAGASDSDRTLDTNWGFPNENFPVVFL